jgi:membrane-bound lytic murein transglycosylase D
MFCLSCFIAGIGNAQSRFEVDQNALLATASAQWLCEELKTVNPAYFVCGKKEWTLPQPGQFALYHDSLYISAESIQRFERLWFPDGDCKRFLSIVAMADVYMPLFKRKTEQLALHPDVALLPIVLSGCNQQYKSADHAGLWAMSYLAARKQHLKIDTLVDERRGGDFTTDAALKHFRYMLEIQHDDYWRATIAYSSGPSLLSEIDSTITGEKLLFLPEKEVAERLGFLAYTKALFQSVHSENQLTHCFDILGHFQPVIIEKPLQVHAIATVLSIEETRLRSTNPVYTGNYLMPGYRKVPFVLEDTLLGRFQLMKDSIARWKPNKPKVEWTDWESYWVNHRVGKGETLGRIAGKYHVTIAQIKKWNKLRSDRIRKGQILKIEQRRKVVREVTQDAQLSPQAEVESEDTTQVSQIPPNEIPAPTQRPSDSGKNQPQAKKKSDEKNSYYTVKSGDSLWSIARKYPRVTEQDLMKWNNCGSNIRPGQKLLIKKK